MGGGGAGIGGVIGLGGALDWSDKSDGSDGSDRSDGSDESALRGFGLNELALGVAVEFRGVEALDCGNSRGVFAGMKDSGRVLEDVLSFREVIDEEMGGGIARHFVVAKSILKSVARKDLKRFDAASTLVFEMDEFHITVDREEDADHEFIADLDGVRRE